jgi:hypothetical protein
MKSLIIMTLMKDGYGILERYPDAMNDESKFKHFKALCKEYGIASNMSQNGVNYT